MNTVYRRQTHEANPHGNQRMIRDVDHSLYRPSCAGEAQPRRWLASCLVCIGPACGPTCRVDTGATSDLTEAIVTDKPKQRTRHDAVEQCNPTSLHLLIDEPIFLGSASAA